MSERVIADPPPAPEKVQKRQERRRGLLLGVTPRAALAGSRRGDRGRDARGALRFCSTVLRHLTSIEERLARLEDRAR